MAFEDRTEEHFARSRSRCVLVKTKAEALRLLAGMNEFALDFETTSLVPQSGTVRLTTICNDDHHFIIDHMFCGSIEDYIEALVGKTIWVFNAKFEQKWIDYYDPDERIQVNDVDFLKKAKRGGMPNKLAWIAKDIGVVMDKEEQNSDWSRPVLTKGQYDYAGFDGHVTWEVKKHWYNQLDEGQLYGFKVFNDAVRATIECEDTGLYLDYGYHAALVHLWERKQATFLRYIRKWTPESVIANIGSDVQLGKFLERELHPDTIAAWPRTGKTNRMQMENSYLRAVARKLPYPMSRWMAAIVGFRYYKKYLSTYGDTLLTKQAMTGKITSRFNIAQATTGRYSSSNSNLQNIPRKPVVRRAFRSPPAGDETMVLADYSGIEVRVLAELSQDKQLLEDAIYGDVHAAGAAQIYHEDYDTVRKLLDKTSDIFKHSLYPIWKDRRSKAKVFTFRLTYGAGAGALSDSLRCTIDEAYDAIKAWANRYPRAYHYRDKMFDIMNSTGYLPVTDGRTIYVFKSDRTLPVAANYPIQGAAASVMYRALYHVRRRFMEHGLDAFLAATVHDEILTYSKRHCAEAVLEQQLAGMRDGWLDIFPGTNTDNLSDFAIGDTWAEKP